MTQQDAARTYDDLPESAVSTVLQVPLLWGSDRTTDRSGIGAHRRPSGRHRPDRQANGNRGRVPRQPEPEHRVREPRVQRQPVARRQPVTALTNLADHPMAHTARVGLVSAGLVLALFAGVLLALALWLP